MRLTKNDMARVIVQALYNMPALPAEDHPEVVKRAQRGTVGSLAKQHDMACKALNSVKRIVTPLDVVPPGLGWKLVDGNTFQNVWVRP